MSFDIKGNSPTSEHGYSFHLSNWAWRPLAEMIKRLAPAIIVSKCDGWDYNDGKGLDKWYCYQLADELQKMIDTGLVAAYLSYRKDRLVTQPSGETLTSSYSLSVDEVQQFINFLRDCGGFEIW